MGMVMSATLVTWEEATSLALGFVWRVIGTLGAVTRFDGVAVLVNQPVTVGTLANDGVLGELRVDDGFPHVSILWSGGRSQ